MDLDKLIREADIAQMEGLLQNVTFARLEKADLKRIKDKNIIKLFKLGQLTTEYLLYTHVSDSDINQLEIRRRIRIGVRT